MASTITCDVAIAGGGLAGGLVALALAKARPELDIRVVEAGETLGGNHVWSFFGSDLSHEDRALVAPLVVHAWPGYEVAFPAHRRSIAQPYYSVTSERFDAVLRRTLPPHMVMTGRKILGVSPTAIVLDGGDRIEAGGVIDARGAADLSTLEVGWQKFVGREFELERPHGLDRPIVMDATVAQHDGYRFVYCLPFGETRMFIEDTYYSDTPTINVRALERRIDLYAASRGWHAIAPTTDAVGAPDARDERGVLPVVIGGNFELYWRSGGNRVAKAGVRAGLFQPTTGYSLPDAVRTAHAIARATDLSGAGLHELTYGIAKAAWDERGFYRMLDAMLFRAAEPDQRYRILERFYRLDPALIGRFYASRSTTRDKLRVLSGKPPVPVTRAIRAIMDIRK